MSKKKTSGKSFPSREKVLESVRNSIGFGAGRKLAQITRVTYVGTNKWLRDGIPPERCGLVSALTGIPEHEIRPDVFVPPPLPECQPDAQSHAGSVAGGAA